jgi:hypothetical protein
MKLQRLSTAILVVTIELVLLATARPGIAQTDLNAELRQALCAQNWGQALDVLDRMKRASGREYASQINLYRARVQVLARQNVKLSSVMERCSTSSPSDSAPANNPIPPAPTDNTPPTPGIPLTPDIPPAPGILPAPSNDVLPVPPL